MSKYMYKKILPVQVDEPVMSDDWEFVKITDLYNCVYWIFRKKV